MTDRTQHVIDAIDGALDDWTVSGDAMRWTPEPGVGPYESLRRRAAVDWPVAPRALPELVTIAPYRDRRRPVDRYSILVPDRTLTPPSPDPEQVAAIGEQLGQAVRAFTEWAERAAELVGMTLTEWQRNVLELAHANSLPVVPERSAAEDDPRARALELRRTRNTGPSRDVVRQRRPRQHR